MDFALRPDWDSALVAKWPDPIDLANDIFIPRKTAACTSQLIAALQSRNLWSVIAATLLYLFMGFHEGMRRANTPPITGDRLLHKVHLPFQGA